MERETGFCLFLSFEYEHYVSGSADDVLSKQGGDSSYSIKFVNFRNGAAEASPPKVGGYYGSRKRKTGTAFDDDG